MPLRLVYGAGVALAAWVAAWGLLAPAEIERAVPWPMPPLHARFVGALYLSGAVCLFGLLRASRWSRQAVVVPMIAVWTGVLLVVLVHRLDATGAVWSTVVVWFVAYAALPVVAAGHAWRHRHDRQPGPGSSSPSWLRRVLAAQGVLLAGASAIMLVSPGTVAAVWPWPAPELALQVYAGPLLAYGVGSLLGARRAALDDLRVLLAGLATFSAAVLVVSIVHFGVFGAGPATWLWFAGFGAACVLYGWLMIRHRLSEKVMA